MHVTIFLCSYKDENEGQLKAQKHSHVRKTSHVISEDMEIFYRILSSIEFFQHFKRKK